MCRFGSNLDATISDIDIEYYKQRATEGGLFISEPSFIPKISGGYHQSFRIYRTTQNKLKHGNKYCIYGFP